MYELTCLGFNSFTDQFSKLEKINSNLYIYQILVHGRRGIIRQQLIRDKIYICQVSVIINMYAGKIYHCNNGCSEFDTFLHKMLNINFITDNLISQPKINYTFRVLKQTHNCGNTKPVYCFCRRFYNNLYNTMVSISDVLLWVGSCLG